MSSSSLTVNGPVRGPRSRRVAALFGGLSGLAAAFGAGLRAHHEFERLSRLSDSQLDALGLTRESLPRHIFARHLAH